MTRIVLLYLFIIIILPCTDLSGAGSFKVDYTTSNLPQQDTLKKNQDLYNGKVWTNKHRRINGDPYLFANYFLPATVSGNVKTYKNLTIRYDIFSDEITIPVNREEILQLNKEMVDSFTLSFENQVFKFIQIRDTLSRVEGFKGYVNVLYQQKSALFIKYIKLITPEITDKSDGDFLQTKRIFLVKDGIVSLIGSVNDLYKALNTNKTQVNEFLKKNKLKISRDKPENFIPLIKYYDNKGL
jgi:hypothetical protein